MSDGITFYKSLKWKDLLDFRSLSTRSASANRQYVVIWKFLIDMDKFGGLEVELPTLGSR